MEPGDGGKDAAGLPGSLPRADRRASARIPLRIMVRELAQGGSFDEHAGNLSLGGVFFTESHPPIGSLVEVRFVIPSGRGTEVRASGEIVRVSLEDREFGAHVKFHDLSLDAELAIARFLEALAPGE